jgi:hypothetical protein
VLKNSTDPEELREQLRSGTSLQGLVKSATSGRTSDPAEALRPVVLELISSSQGGGTKKSARNDNKALDRQIDDLCKVVARLCPLVSGIVAPLNTMVKGSFALGADNYNSHHSDCPLVLPEQFLSFQASLPHEETQQSLLKVGELSKLLGDSSKTLSKCQELIESLSPTLEQRNRYPYVDVVCAALKLAVQMNVDFQVKSIKQTIENVGQLFDEPLISPQGLALLSIYGVGMTICGLPDDPKKFNTREKVCKQWTTYLPQFLERMHVIHDAAATVSSMVREGRAGILSALGAAVLTEVAGESERFFGDLNYAEELGEEYLRAEKDGMRASLKDSMNSAIEMVNALRAWNHVGEIVSKIPGIQNSEELVVDIINQAYDLFRLHPSFHSEGIKTVGPDAAMTILNRRVVEDPESLTTLLSRGESHEERLLLSHLWVDAYVIAHPEARHAVAEINGFNKPDQVRESLKSLFPLVLLESSSISAYGSKVSQALVETLREAGKNLDCTTWLTNYSDTENTKSLSDNTQLLQKALQVTWSELYSLFRLSSESGRRAFFSIVEKADSTSALIDVCVTHPTDEVYIALKAALENSHHNFLSYVEHTLSTRAKGVTPQRPRDEELRSEAMQLAIKDSVRRNLDSFERVIVVANTTDLPRDRTGIIKDCREIIGKAPDDNDCKVTFIDPSSLSKIQKSSVDATTLVIDYTRHGHSSSAALKNIFETGQIINLSMKTSTMSVAHFIERVARHIQQLRAMG